MALPLGLGYLGGREQGETQEQFLQRVRKGNRAGLGVVTGGTIHGISDPESVFSKYGEGVLNELQPVEATGRSGGNMPFEQLLTFGQNAPGAFNTYGAWKQAPAGSPAAPPIQAPSAPLSEASARQQLEREAQELASYGRVVSTPEMLRSASYNAPSFTAPTGEPPTPLTPFNETTMPKTVPSSGNESYLDMFKRLRGELGLGTKETELAGTQKQILSVQDQLDKLEKDISARASGVGGLVEAQRRRELSLEQAPLREQLIGLQRGEAGEQAGLTSSRQQLEDLMKYGALDRAEIEKAKQEAITSSKPIEAGGVLYQKQSDGSYKAITAKENDLQFVSGTDNQQSGYFNKTTGKFTPLSSKIKSDPSNGINNNNITTTTTIADNSASGSILSQTGLSLIGFNYLTQGTTALTRMGQNDRKAVMNEAQNFLNKRGIDVSTFQSQYKSYNDVLEKNIDRMNRTKIMENEIDGTLSNLLTVADNAELGKLNWGNVVKIWAGKNINDPIAQKYAFHLQQLKNEMAGYFAASQGKTSPDLVDNNDAEKTIHDGINKKSMIGLQEAIKASTVKMSGVLQNSVDAARKSVWELFGVGNKYKPQGQNVSEITKIFNNKTYIKVQGGWKLKK